MNIYVGNLQPEVSEEDIRQAFESFGKVNFVKIIRDRNSGRSRGFGFIKMPSNREAQSAINALHGKELKGRMLKVNAIPPRTDSLSVNLGFGAGRSGNGKGMRGYGNGYSGNGQGGYGAGKTGYGGNTGSPDGNRRYGNTKGSGDRDRWR